MLFVKKLEKFTHTNMTNLLDISFILKKLKWNVQDYFRPDYILYDSFMARLFKKKISLCLPNSSNIKNIT